MVGKAAEKKIYDAARIGDVTTFQQVLQEDPHLLDVVSSPCLRNVLHIAIRQGQVSIVDEVLNINSELVRDLDSKNSSSLHIAAANGNVEIAERLLLAAPEVCWWRDTHDMNPIHIAAMKGHVGILEKLLQQDSFPVMERLHRGQTVLHLCVKHRQLEAFKVLANKLGELVCAKDDDGETLLHLAVRCNQLEIIRYLVESKKIEKQTENSMGKLPQQLLDESPPPTTHDYSEIKKMLNNLSQLSLMEKFLPKMTDITMVVVVLIATMAFQAAVSPPGGVWPDDTSSHRAGKAVMASTHPKIYKHFVRANTTAFVSSLITIFLNPTGWPSANFIFLAIATYAMWVSLTSISVSYGASLIMTNPMQTQSVGHIVAIVVSVFLSIIVLIFICVDILGLYMSWKRKKRQQEDLTTAPLILRCFYRFFQDLDEPPEDALNRYKPILRHLLRRSDSPSLHTAQAA